MFNLCSGLTSLDLSNFDTNNVDNMIFMFAGCYALTLVKFGARANVSNVTSMNDMFSEITTNGTLYYPSAYESTWNNILVTNQSTSDFPSTWTAVAVDYENK
jgi:surface protein